MDLPPPAGAAAVISATPGRITDAGFEVSVTVDRAAVIFGALSSPGDNVRASAAEVAMAAPGGEAAQGAVGAGRRLWEAENAATGRL